MRHAKPFFFEKKKGFALPKRNFAETEVSAPFPRRRFRSSAARASECKSLWSGYWGNSYHALTPGRSAARTPSFASLRPSPGRLGFQTSYQCLRLPREQVSDSVGTRRPKVGAETREFLDGERLVARSGTGGSSILTAPYRRRGQLGYAPKKFLFGGAEPFFFLKEKWFRNHVSLHRESSVALPSCER